MWVELPRRSFIFGHITPNDALDRKNWMLNFNRILLNSNNDKINISYPEDTHRIQDSIHTRIFDLWVMAVPVVCLDSCLLLAFKSYGHEREIL